MAFTHGKNSYMNIDDSSGTPTDISSYVNNVDGLPGEVEMADITHFGDGGHRRLPGLENVTISISGDWDPTVDGVLAQGRDTARTFEFGPAGSGTGNVSYTGECYVSSYTVTAPVADKVSWTATLQVDGTVTRGTFA